MSIAVQSLHIYPIKSLGGVNLTKAEISSRGFQFDRRMMLVNSSNRHVTQRELSQMALLDVQVDREGVTVQHRLTKSVIKLSSASSFVEELQQVKIWKDHVMAQKANHEINEWFSDVLKENLTLVSMPDQIKRPVNNHKDSIVGFADSNQFLIIGQSSLDHLNSQLTAPIDINRFRPNIVFSRLEPHEEDDWKSIRIGSVEFEVTKPCARCNLTQVNQETGVVGEEPIRTLSNYRLMDGQILFGVYLKSIGGLGGSINVGDSITITS